jgi:hypothetical protein
MEEYTFADLITNLDFLRIFFDLISPGGNYIEMVGERRAAPHFAFDVQKDGCAQRGRNQLV